MAGAGATVGLDAGAAGGANFAAGVAATGILAAGGAATTVRPGRGLTCGACFTGGSMACAPGLAETIFPEALITARRSVLTGTGLVTAGAIMACATG